MSVQRISEGMRISNGLTFELNQLIFLHSERRKGTASFSPLLPQNHLIK